MFLANFSPPKSPCFPTACCSINMKSKGGGAWQHLKVSVAGGALSRALSVFHVHLQIKCQLHRCRGPAASGSHLAKNLFSLFFSVLALPLPGMLQLFGKWQEEGALSQVEATVNAKTTGPRIHATRSRQFRLLLSSVRPQGSSSQPKGANISSLPAMARYGMPGEFHLSSALPQIEKKSWLSGQDGAPHIKGPLQPTQPPFPVSY